MSVSVNQSGSPLSLVPEERPVKLDLCRVRFFTTASTLDNGWRTGCRRRNLTTACPDRRRQSRESFVVWKEKGEAFLGVKHWHLLLGDPSRILEDDIPLGSVVCKQIHSETSGFEGDVEVLHEVTRVDTWQLQVVTKQN